MKHDEWQPPVSEKDRGRIIEEVVERVCAQKAEAAARNPGLGLENIINDTLYNERQRAKSEGKSDEMKQELEFLSGVTAHLMSADDERKLEMLKKLVSHYAEDIAGHFDPSVYKFTTKLLPFGLEAIFSASSPAMLFRTFPNLPDLRSRISIRGNIDMIKNITRLGTIIVAPTHASNMDSIVVGWGLNEAGLPPVNYGAGKNLFSNKILSFFMNSLGAYKVDRRLRHKLYKDILKEYSAVLLENGYHSLFFPGGTRSRSGQVEKKLKMGLLGTGLTAYVNNLLRGKENPNVYIVPLTINYPIVLEAETLIDDYLQEAGKSRYIIMDDEFSKPVKIMHLISKLMSMESSMALQFGEPLDPFGNPVNEDGVSLDRKGRVVDIRKYVTGADGEVTHDSARDTEYTREMGEALVASFHRNTVVLSTHALAFTLFRMLRRANPGTDLYRLLRFEGEGTVFPFTEVIPTLDRVIQRLLELNAEDRIKIGGSIRPGECAREVMYKALKFFAMYHTKPVVVRQGENLKLNDLNLLYYYHNRLTGWGIEETIEGSAGK